MADACPSEDSLLELVQGSVAPPEATRLQGHVDQCPTCKLLLQTWLQLEASSVSGPALGQRIGRYRILRRVGAGAMGVVYAAHDQELDRQLAIKVLRPEITGAASSSGQGRLRREAQALARLSHPNVVTVFDIGVVGEQPFIAMEYVDGGSLRAWLGEGRRGLKEILGIFQMAGQGLAAAHRAGIVHRDFKLDNVLIGRDGRARVTDFGLARPAEDAATSLELLSPGTLLSDLRLTRTGAVVGTPVYMSPEQLRGEAASALSDQFSYCVALWEALFGDRPFSGRTLADLMESHEQSAPVEPSHGRSVPRWLRRILVRGLSTDPRRRFASMDALLLALGAGAATGRRRWAAIGAASAAGVIATGIVAWRLLLPSPTATLPLPSLASVAPAAPAVSDAPTSVDVRSAQAAAPADAKEGPASSAPRPAPSSAARTRPKSAVSPPGPVPPAAPAESLLRIHVSPWADLHVDDALRGAGTMDYEILLPPGRHVVKLVNPFFVEHTQEVVLPLADTLRVRLERKRKE
ncbi:MAG: serine/threonine protein kinase [Deltaproteobacteria bacterium]|nr:serine/threonine protein kinase [Deltaproteobacteria bacterium]